MFRGFILAGLILVGACACTHLPAASLNAVQNSADNSASASSSNIVAEPGGAQRVDCAQRVNDTLAKVEACIQRGSLWRHLSEFQRISDANPGPDGHGNRDTGTPGYKASVDYVVGLMQQAGYKVRIQQYPYAASQVSGAPQFSTPSRGYAYARDWFVARRSGSGSLTAQVEPPSRSSDGCSLGDFAGFARGDIALLERGACAIDIQVANARAVGAGAVVLYTTEGGAFETRLNDPVDIPVIGVATGAVAAELLSQYRSGSAPIVHIEVQMRPSTGVDYNVIAESPYGDLRHTVAIDAHLDSIYGAGMLDNASGSTSMLDTALAMAKTQTYNRLRYIWFGGEELGLLGSRYYTQHLTTAELRHIVFDVDVDVTATPNFDIQIADPARAHNVSRFPKNVVPQSKVGNDAFYDFFKAGGVISRPAPFGNDGTDSNSFSLVGVPDSGILTEQDCCKRPWEVSLWGGFRGNYEGHVPGFDGGCVDRPHLWCDNLSNNDQFVLVLTSKAVADVTFTLANDPSLGR